MIAQASAGSLRSGGAPVKARAEKRAGEMSETAKPIEAAPDLRPSMPAPTVVILLPCYNEALALPKIIPELRAALPQARILLFDNNSTDGSGEIARALGIEVRLVAFQGKGNVVRRMFADVQADVYLMLDADATYDLGTASALIEAVWEGRADMAVGARVGGRAAFPKWHVFGNWVFNLLIARLFGRGLKDVFSGYRAFSYRFVKSFPAHSEGFAVETEMSIFALQQRIPYVEIPSPYHARLPGSVSKLHTFRDGGRILRAMLSHFKDLRPLAFFGILATAVALVSLWFGVPIIIEYFQIGLVPRLPLAVLSASLGLMSALLMIAGLVLDGIARSRKETRHLRYLSYPRD